MAESSVRWSPTDENYPPKEGLLKSEEENEEYEGLSPLAMGLLQAGASMMRNSGWRNRPMTTSEMIGHAIPAGLGGYLNQEARNQQGEAEFYAQQQAEQQAEQLRIQQEQQQLQIQQAIDQLDLIDTTIINRGTKAMLKEKLKLGGKSFQEAMTKIIELTSDKKAGEPYEHPDFGFGQFDEKGIWKSIEKKDKSIAGIPVGLFTVGSVKAKKVLARQEIQEEDLPEGTFFIDVKPVGFNGEDSGVTMAFLNKNNEQILTEEDKETQSNPTTRYLRADSTELKKAHPDLELNLKSDDLVALNKDDLILGYKLKDEKALGGYIWLAEGNELLRQEKLKRDLEKVVKVKKEAFNITDERFKDYFDAEGNPKIHIPDGTHNVKILPDGNIQFLDADDKPVSATPTMTVARVQKNGDVHNILLNKVTGAFIKDLGLTKKYKEPIDRLKFNAEQAEKANKSKQIDALLDDLKQDYGYSDNLLENLKARSLVDVDKALDEISGYYDSEYSKSEAIKTGKELNLDKNIEGQYEEDLYFKSDGKGGWTEYRPHSSERLSGESGLRKEYNQLTRDFRIASRGYDGVIKGLAQNNGFGDIMAITSFRIMFEPNSVVREAEFEITSKGAGFWEDLKKTPQKWMDGDKLSDKARATMKKLVDEYMVQIKLRANKHYSTYSKIAKDRGYVDNAGIQNPFSTYDFQASGSGDNYDADFGVTEEEGNEEG